MKRRKRRSLKKRLIASARAMDSVSPLWRRMRPDQHRHADHLLSSWGYRFSSTNYHRGAARRAIRRTVRDRP